LTQLTRRLAFKVSSQVGVNGREPAYHRRLAITGSSSPSSYRVSGRLGGVLAAGWGGPAECSVGKLVRFPVGVLFEPVVVPAFRIRVTQARPAACLIWRVVLVVALAGRPSADRAGAGGVPDLGEVPEPGARVVAFGFVLVVAAVNGE